jgi:hypothetical protein
MEKLNASKAPATKLAAIKGATIVRKVRNRPAPKPCAASSRNTLVCCMPATALRATVPGLVQALVDDGILMEIEGEYHLQTTEGAAWESEFRRRRTALLNNEPQLAAHRGQLLSKAVAAALAGVNVLHGAARVKRKVTPHHGMTAPPATDDLTIWVRDGFQESASAVIQDIQQRSVADATIHCLIPKTKADPLKNTLAAALAADEALNFKGQPSGDEGKEACRAMVTRKARSCSNRRPASTAWTLRPPLWRQSAPTAPCSTTRTPSPRSSSPSARRCAVHSPRPRAGMPPRSLPSKPNWTPMPPGTPCRRPNRRSCSKPRTSRLSPCLAPSPIRTC